jgi:uncharacterized membrane protein
MDSDSTKYKWGIFYFDAEDRRVVVPKRNQFMGWTLNYANPISYAILAGLIGIVIFLAK